MTSRGRRYLGIPIIIIPPDLISPSPDAWPSIDYYSNSPTYDDVVDWLREPIRRLGIDGLPIWGTCAGAIVLATHASDLDRPNLKLMDIDVRRNAFGRQVDSFEEDLAVAGFGGPAFHAVFIRAPLIERVRDGVSVLAQLSDGTIVAARQGHLLATSFHPELTGDARFHELFAAMAAGYAAGRAASK